MKLELQFPYLGYMSLGKGDIQVPQRLFSSTVLQAPRRLEVWAEPHHKEEIFSDESCKKEKIILHVNTENKV